MGPQKKRGVVVGLLVLLVVAGVFAFYSYRKQTKEWQEFDDAYAKVSNGLTGPVSESWTPGVFSGSGEMSLSGTNIADGRLKQLEGVSTLYKLDLSDTGITDAGLEHLKSLPQLKELNLHHTSVSDSAVDNFHAALPDCVVSK